MPLPKCVKVDERSDALESEGWRHIGTLLTFEGNQPRRINTGVRGVVAEDVLVLAQQIEWSGRLWRDPKIAEKETLDEALTQIRSFKGEIYAVGRYPAAFGMFMQRRVVLIGTHPAAQGLGLASALIHHAICGDVIAGTYSDNEGAIRLYKSLGMKQTRSQEVYHK